jgi:hypothetical protein
MSAARLIRGTPRPLYGWTAHQLAGLAARADAPWQAWIQAWGLEGAGAVEARALTREPAARWVLAWEGGGRRAWLQAGAADVLGAGLFALQGLPRTPVARAVADAAAADAVRALAQALGLEVRTPAASGPPPDGAFDGAVHLALPLAGEALRVVLDAACVAALVEPAPAAAAPPRAPLVALEAALARRRLRLQVELGACELDLGTLQGLRVGDVLPLPLGLDAPARMLDAGGQHLCDAYIGRQGGSKAVELARIETFNEETV